MPRIAPYAQDAIQRWSFVFAALLLFACVAAGCRRGSDRAASDPAAPNPSPAAVVVDRDPETDLSYTISTPQIQARIDELNAAYDPHRDGWDSEAFHDDSNRVLQRLAKLLASSSGAGEANDAKFAGLITPHATATTLRPADLSVVFDDGVFQVSRPQPHDESAHEPLGALAPALSKLVAVWSADTPLRVKLKQFSIDLEKNIPSSRVFYSAVGMTSAGRLQQQATWKCQWTKDRSSPRLLAIQLIDFEQTLLKSEHNALFSDCTEAVFSGQDCYTKQLRYGANYWLQRVPGYPLDCLNGITLGDVNGDGRDDVYLPQGQGLPNRLLIAQNNGVLVDASAEFGVDYLDETRSALLVDLDNDGDQDLVIATIYAVVVLENDGGRRFTERWCSNSDEPNGVRINDASSMAAADVNGDGLLDLYVGAYSNSIGEIGVLSSPTPYNDANNGAQNVMLQNRGGFQFADVTHEWGLAENNSRFTLAVAFEDYDNDGDADLYVTNDFGRNNLYKNVGTADMAPRFTDVAASTGVEDTSFGMSVSWGDVDRDGRMDLYISNMFSAAGNRVTYQRQFTDGLTSGERAQMQYLARGNSLFVNVDEEHFVDVSEAAGVMNSHWAWASKFCDINNDGWQDLLSLDGFLTGPKPGDL